MKNYVNLIQESVNNRPIKIRKVILFLTMFGLGFYICYHAVNGKRGIKSFFQFNSEIQLLREELKDLQEERIKLEHKVNLLKDNSLDSDSLEESVKRNLGYAKPKEFVFSYSEEKSEGKKKENSDEEKED